LQQRIELGDILLGMVGFLAGAAQRATAYLLYCGLPLGAGPGPPPLPNPDEPAFTSFFTYT
jgi:hypothetical protein